MGDNFFNFFKVKIQIKKSENQHKHADITKIKLI